MSRQVTVQNKDILFHADDYGVTKEQSCKILECYKNGVLNSISVIPNSPALSECLQILDDVDKDKKIRRVLHLNFVEGKPLADKDKVDMLIDETGCFNRSFVQILKWNYTLHGEKREKLKNQLKNEISAQVDAVTKVCDYCISAIDAHQHYHMIPIVLDALMEVLDEKGMSIEEIRIPVDPVAPLLRTRDIRKPQIINFAKWGILKFYERRNRKRLKERNISCPVFFGIFYTCEMKYDIVSELLPKYKKYAQRKNEKLELMFHPGNLTARYELLDERSDELAEFYMSENRFAEAECMKRLLDIYKEGL